VAIQRAHVFLLVLVVLMVHAAISGDALPAAASSSLTSGRATYNLRVVTDASPDLTDLTSFVNSATSGWPAIADKVWALYYWSHILKRQTAPMVVHGFDVTDPIRNFSDYGFTMCSTASGINQSLYEVLGLAHQYWDVCNHTVSAVEYDGTFHLIDTSMSNLVTTDDGVTLASVTEAAADQARLVREHSLYSSSPNGFLTGNDAQRHLSDFASPENGAVSPGFSRDICENGLKYRDYYYNWNAGHRYVLNLRDDESYTRYYRRLGTGPDYFVGTENVDVPDPANTREIDAADRFGIRGNGAWSFTPKLTAAGWADAAYRWSNVAAGGSGLQPLVAGTAAEVVYKVQAANVITSQSIRAEFSRPDPGASANVSVSTNHGVLWRAVGSTATANTVEARLGPEVSGAYETLVRVQMAAANGAPDGIALTALTIDTVTQVNVKALPKLNIGRNEILIEAGDQSDTEVLWPDLRGAFWRNDIVDSGNIASQSDAVPRRYAAVVYPSVLTEDAYLTYRIDAPTDVSRFTYGGRLHNFAAGSYIDFLHSYDGGATWIRSFHFTSINKPWDVIHYETIADVPPGVRSVLFKFVFHNTSPTVARATGLYNARMEVNHLPAAGGPKPIDVTFRWKEMREDRSLVDRSHRQRVTEFPFKYIVNVGGSDHPLMESLKLNVEDPDDPTPLGYSDGTDVGGSRYLPFKRTDGANLAVGRPYTFSRAPSGFQASAPAADTTILTDGVVGAPSSGGSAYWWGQCWSANASLDLQIDLGAVKSVAAFRAHLFGYPFWDALRGQVQDRIEIQTSVDGAVFASQGELQTSLWKKDVPVNYMLPDDEKATAWNFERTIAVPVEARYVRYHLSPKRILCASELQVFDSVTLTPFDLRLSSTTPVGIPPVPTNQPPTVSVNEPSQGATYTSPASVTMSASTADADGSIVRVEFLVDGGIVATDTAQPWSATWTTDVVGAHTLTARAYDNAGAVTTSSPVVVTVQPPPHTDGEDVVMWAGESQAAFDWFPQPDASAAGGVRLQGANRGIAKLSTALASPARYFELTFNAIAGRGYRLWIRGQALSDAPGNDSVHVQFDGSLDASGSAAYRIGTTGSIVYILEECGGCGISGWGWQDNGWGAPGALGPLVYFQSAGPQRIRVQPREDGLSIDQIVLSSTRWVDVAPGTSKDDATILPESDPQSSNQRPAVALTSPAEGASFAPPAVIEIAAQPSDADGRVVKVEFFANDVLIGAATSPPWSLIWNATMPGGFELTARAFDDAGSATTSAPVNVILPSGSPGEDVVLYAADAAVQANWATIVDDSAAGGRFLQNPDLGQAKLPAALEAPASYFELTFNALAGRPYRLWIRGKALSNGTNNDSVFVQYDGTVDENGAPTYRIGTASALGWNLEECLGCGLSEWGWQDNGWGAIGLRGPTVRFAHDGAQTMRIQVREDGLGIDQVVLSSLRWLNASPGNAKIDNVILPKQ